MRPSGGLSFVLLRKTDGRSTRLSLGAVTSMRVDDARRQYHALMAKPDSEHPTKRTHKVLLFRNFVDGPWKDAHFPRYKPSTRRTVNNLLTSQLLARLRRNSSRSHHPPPRAALVRRLQPNRSRWRQSRAAHPAPDSRIPHRPQSHQHQSRARRDHEPAHRPHPPISRYGTGCAPRPASRTCACTI